MLLSTYFNFNGLINQNYFYTNNINSNKNILIFRNFNNFRFKIFNFISFILNKFSLI